MILTAEQAKKAAHTLSGLSNHSRLQILSLLATNGEMSAGSIEVELGYSQTYISHNLDKLVLCKLITRRRSGRSIFYNIVSEDIKLSLLHLLAITVYGKDSI